METKEIELKFILPPESTYYRVYWRIKEDPNKKPNIFKKIINWFIDPWTPIMEWCHADYQKPSINTHPEYYWQEHLIDYDEIEATKQKFKTVQDVRDFEAAEYERMKQSIAKYNKLKEKYKSVIY